MSSIFGNSGLDDQITSLNLQTITNVTNISEAVAALDDEVSIFRNNVQLNPLDQIINDIKDDITAIDINNVNSSISNLQTTKLDITTYDANVPGYQTAANVSSSINSALTPYRTSAAQDIIDSGKYSTSNPAGYQTAANVSSSISAALTPYRTSADEDIINATKLNTSDLKAPIIPFDVAGGFVPSSVSIKNANAYYDTNFYTNPSTVKTLQYSNAPLFDCPHIVNDFNGASYGTVGSNVFESTDGINWDNIYTLPGGSITVIYFRKVGNYLIIQDNTFNVYYTDNAFSIVNFLGNFGEAIRDAMYSTVWSYHYFLTSSNIRGSIDLTSGIDFVEPVQDENEVVINNPNFLVEDESNGLVGITFTHPETKVIVNSAGTWNFANTYTITLSSTFQQMTDIIRYGLTKQHYYICSQDVLYYIIAIDLVAPFTFTSIPVIGASFTQANLFIPSPNPSNVRYVEFANNGLGSPMKILSFSNLTDAFVASVDNIVNTKYIALLYDNGSGPAVDYITIVRDSGNVQTSNVQDACITLNSAQVEIRTNLSSNYTNTTNLQSGYYSKTETDTLLNDKYDASNPSNYTTNATVATNHYTKTETDTILTNYTKYETSYVGYLQGSPANGITYVWSTSWNTTEKRFLVGRDIIIDKLLVNVRQNNSSGGTQSTYTLRKNGVDTAMTAFILNNASQLTSISTASPISFVAGDTYSVSLNRTYTGGTQTDQTVAVLIRYV